MSKISRHTKKERLHNESLSFVFQNRSSDLFLELCVQTVYLVV